MSVWNSDMKSSDDARVVLESDDNAAQSSVCRPRNGVKSEDIDNEINEHFSQYGFVKMNPHRRIDMIRSLSEVCIIIL